MAATQVMVKTICWSSNQAKNAISCSYNRYIADYLHELDIIISVTLYLSTSLYINALFYDQRFIVYIVGGKTYNSLQYNEDWDA